MTIRRSSVQRFNSAHSLGGLILISSLGFTLEGCSGSDTSDEPLADGNSSGAMSPNAMSQPANPRVTPSPSDADSSEPPTDEDGPGVIDLDDLPAPNDSSGDAQDDDPDAEASATPVTPVAELDVPGTDHCAAVEDWDPEWVQFEEDVLLLVNEIRSQPGDCGVEGQFAAAAPLTMDPMLRCSARLHSLDMFEQDFFEHLNRDGLQPQDRMIAAGFQGSLLGENIAQGQRTPEEVMLSWMGSDGHCANIMRSEFTSIGIGYSPGATVREGKSDFWTQNFGTPVRRRSSL